MDDGIKNFIKALELILKDHNLSEKDRKIVLDAITELKGSLNE